MTDDDDLDLASRLSITSLIHKAMEDGPEAIVQFLIDCARDMPEAERAEFVDRTCALMDRIIAKHSPRH